MIKTMKKIAIILSIIISVTSCNVLDQVSPNDVAGSDVFKTKAGAEAALVGMYSSLQQRYYYGGMFQNAVDLNSDIGTGGGYQNTVLDEISNVNISTSNTIVSNIYLAMYYTIATANAIIAQVDGVNDPTFTKAEKDNMKGQALAVRALAHFDALRTFGEHWDTASEYGIPVVLTPQKATDVVTRSTVANSYAAIVKDITDALTLINPDDRSQAYFNAVAIKALQARVYLYSGKLASAADAASTVIDDGAFELLDQDNFQKIFSAPYQSKESIFELNFNTQNQSFLNVLTYLRTSALRSDVFFLAKEELNTFFTNRAGDLRANLVDFSADDNDVSIQPDGRTQKYRGENTRDNPAFMFRIAEMYLIRAEAKGYPAGMDDLNTVRTNRGLGNSSASNESEFIQDLLDERKAELNFEGHRMFDLARKGEFAVAVGAVKNSSDYTISDFNAIFPIPKQETITGKLKQNPGYPAN
jgi:hypothetical protein